MSDNNEKRIGFYSAKAAQNHTRYIWEMEDGTTKELTNIAEKGKEDEYKWDDKVNHGYVLKFIKSITNCNNPYKRFDA